MREGRPSETAARIAVSTAAAARDPVLRQLLADPAEPWSERFARAHSPRAREQLEQWRSGRSGLLSLLGDVLEPGGALLILVRKRWIEDQVRAALAAGARQVVVIGAGYDTLGLRLAGERASLRVFELDHPATQAVKRGVLEAHGGCPPGLDLVPVDLSRESIAPALRGAGFRGRVRSVFVAEGVLMYLAGADVEALLSFVAQRTPAGSRFVFSLLDRRLLADRASATSRTARMLAFDGEPIRSGHDPRRMPAFVRRQGLSLLARADHKSLRRDYLEPLAIDRPLSEGEFLVAAEVGLRRSAGSARARPRAS